MFKKVLIAASILAVSSQSFAGGHEKPHAQAWTNFALENQLRTMPEGDAAKGQIVHEQMMCNACHGEKGESPTRNYASLNGQTADYTIKMMLDYRDARRWENYGQANIMVKIAQALNDQQVADVAAFYASNPSTLWQTEALSAERFAKTDRLVRKGDASRMITPCASCHGAEGQGKEITPAIAGQIPEYFIRTMKAYQGGHRQNDVNEGMSQFTHDLSDEEIQALAHYYAGMGGQK